MSTFYWVNKGSSFWVNKACWSLTSGGPPGTSLPTINDDVVFDGANGANGTCFLSDANQVTYAKSITINGYTGILNFTGVVEGPAHLYMPDGSFINWQTGTWTIGTYIKIFARDLTVTI